jgi:hypothetical protein
MAGWLVRFPLLSGISLLFLSLFFIQKVISFTVVLTRERHQEACRFRQARGSLSRDAEIQCRSRNRDLGDEVAMKNSR